MSQTQKRRLPAHALALLACAVVSVSAARGQEERPLPVCDGTRALHLIRQQADKAKDLNQVLPRISIMLRAAGLLWRVERETARSIFAEAYEVAEADSRRKAEEPHKGVRLAVAPDDARLTVLRAIAEYDAEWARRLSAELAKDVKPAADSGEGATAGNRDAGAALLSLATALLPAQKELAISLFRTSFRGPASSHLPAFLYKLADTNQDAANQLYVEAVGRYAESPVGELLYLSAYPYGLSRPAGPEAPAVFLQVPPNFAPSARAQQAFLTTLLLRGNKLLQQSTAETGLQGGDLELSHLYLALSGLEQVIGQRQPEFLERVLQLRSSAGAYLSQEEMRNVAASWQRQQEELQDPFTKLVEKAEQAKSSPRKDALIAQALMAAKDEEKLSRVEKLLDQVGDADLRRQLLNWLYFKQAQKATEEGRFEHAAQLAEKVDSLDHRAYLLFEIAAKALDKKVNDQSRARELLDRVAAAAEKAPDTSEKARTMLGVVYLYAKFDAVRALKLLRDATRTINAVAEPDLSSLAIDRQLQGRGFKIYATYQVGGFSFENAVGALAAYDFEGALASVENLENHPLRATAILALSARCMDLAQPAKARKKIRD